MEKKKKMRAACLQLFNIADPISSAPTTPAPAPAPASAAAAPAAADSTPAASSSRRKGKQRDPAKGQGLDGIHANLGASGPSTQRPYQRPPPPGPLPPIPYNTHPLPGGTFAAAARRAPAQQPATSKGEQAVDQLLALQRAFPELPQHEVLALHRQALKQAASPTTPSAPQQKQMKSTTKGPAQQVVYLYTEATFNGNYEAVVPLINHRLTAARRRLCVLQVREDMGYILLHLDGVPTQEDLEPVQVAAQLTL
jgi:hypothetical protein